MEKVTNYMKTVKYLVAAIRVRLPNFGASIDSSSSQDNIR